MKQKYKKKYLEVAIMSYVIICKDILHPNFQLHKQWPLHIQII